MTKKHIGSGIDLGAVFAARAGGILATLLFIPRYQALLTPTDFGLVAIILSLQSLFLTFDLGISTIVGTEIANARESAALLRAREDWHHGELAILSCAIVVGSIAIPISLLGGLAVVGWPQTVLIIILIASLLLANIAQAGINALQKYRLATTIFFIATLARGAVALLLMIGWRTDVSAFLLGQASVSVMHAAVTHFVLSYSLAARTPAAPPFAISRSSLKRLWARSGPMIIYTLSGACALQLDKTIIARCISLELAGLYYLATVYALTPIAVLGGPIYQYFLPKVGAAQGADVELVAARFQFLTVAAVVAPTTVLVVDADIWLSIWLPRTNHRDLIASIASILIVGAAVSATGYYPTAKLLAGRKEHFLSRLGAISAILVLVMATLAALTLHSAKAVAAIYVAYYCAACLILWIKVSLPVRNLLISYVGPAVCLVVLCTISCLVIRVLNPTLAGSLAAAALCAAETAAIAWLWWHRYGFAPDHSPQEVRCPPSR